MQLIKLQEVTIFQIPSSQFYFVFKEFVKISQPPFTCIYMYVRNSYVSVSQTTREDYIIMSGIVESLHNAVNAGLHVKQDWVDMGFGIADTVAKIVDQVLKFV